MQPSGTFSFHETASSAAAPARPGVRHILLIDDVLTTGATLTASFLALRSVYPLPVRISVATLSAVL